MYCAGKWTKPSPELTQKSMHRLCCVSYTKKGVLIQGQQKWDIYILVPGIGTWQRTQFDGSYNYLLSRVFNGSFQLSSNIKYVTGTLPNIDFEYRFRILCIRYNIEIFWKYRGNTEIISNIQIFDVKNRILLLMLTECFFCSCVGTFFFSISTAVHNRYHCHHHNNVSSPLGARAIYIY